MSESRSVAEVGEKMRDRGCEFVCFGGRGGLVGWRRRAWFFELRVGR